MISYRKMALALIDEGYEPYYVLGLFPDELNDLYNKTFNSFFNHE